MDYGKILTRALQIIWKYKILWLFGFLANCGGNAGGSSGASSSGGNVPTFNYQFDADPNNLPPGMYQFFENLGRFFERNAERLGFLFVLLIFAVLILIVITFFIRVYGQVGLVRGILKAEGDAPAKLSFSEVTAEIRPFFWRLTGFQLLIFLAFLLLTGVIVLVMIAGSILTLGVGLICFLPLLCFLVPIGWAIAVIIKQAVIAMLVDDLSIGDSLKRGWEIVRMNAVDYLVMGLILFIGAWLLTLIFSLPQIIAMIPVFSALFNGIITDHWQGIMTGMWVSVACLLAYLPVFLVLRGALTSYTDSAWVLTYLEATRPGGQLEETPAKPPTLEAETETT
jgi:hypothetical protein